MYQQGANNTSSPIDLQNYLSASINIGDKLMDHHHQPTISSIPGKEPSPTIEDLKLQILQYGDDGEKLKLIIKEQDEMIKHQQSLLEQYRKEIACLKTVNESFLNSQYPFTSAKLKTSSNWSPHHHTEECETNPGLIKSTPIIKTPRDSKYDTRKSRLYKKGWPQCDKDLLNLCFRDFIEGESKYPCTSDVDAFLVHHPEFLSSFNFTEKHKKIRLRGQLNNMKKTKEKQRQKYIEQQQEEVNFHSTHTAPNTPP